MMLRLLAFLALSGTAWAQHSHEGDVGAFYQRWMVPPARSMSCCNNEDCYPTSIKLEDGKYYARRREDGQWIFIHPSRLEQNQEEGNIRESPDFNSHACMQKPGYQDTVFCATIGIGN